MIYKGYGCAKTAYKAQSKNVPNVSSWNTTGKDITASGTTAYQPTHEI